ncbi:MAG: hypothetical protein WCF24_00655 [Acidimicrobiales bacterium]
MPAQAPDSGTVQAWKVRTYGIVNDLLGQFVAYPRERDLDGALQLFGDYPVLSLRAPPG